jgi:hypothetical protein
MQNVSGDNVFFNCPRRVVLLIRTHIDRTHTRLPGVHGVQVVHRHIRVRTLTFTS